jgi:hypothetical protein
LSGAGLPFAKIGRVGGDRMKINDLIDISIDQVHRAFYQAMTDFMEQSAAAVG